MYGSDLAQDAQPDEGRIHRLVRTQYRRLALSCMGIAFVFTFAIAYVNATHNLDLARGHRIEQVRATRVVEHFSLLNCGKGTHLEDIWWHSAAPPAGLPATFEQRHTCDSRSVGDTTAVVRIRHAAGAVQYLWLDATTRTGAAIFALALGVGIALAVGATAWLGKARIGC